MISITRTQLIFMKQKVFALNTEQSMVKLLLEGCQNTFAELYDHYAPVLLGVITRIVGNEKISNEILQKTFIKIWEIKNSYDFYKESLFTWMIKIARETSETEQNIYYIKNQIPANSVYTRATERFSTQSNTTKAIAINKDENEVLDLVYFKGYSFTEAATKLNIASDTLKATLKIAIGKLNGTVIV